MILKKNLNEFLKKNKISISELAKETGVPKSNISKWLSGSTPNLEQLDKVAQFFNLSIEELAFGRETKNSINDIIDKFEIHSGLYEINIKKVNVKK